MEKQGNQDFELVKVECIVIELHSRLLNLVWELLLGVLQRSVIKCSIFFEGSDIPILIIWSPEHEAQYLTVTKIKEDRLTQATTSVTS